MAQSPHASASADKKLYTMKEAYDALSISITTLYKLLKERELKSRPIGKRRYVTVESVDAFIARGVAASYDAGGKLILDTRLDHFRGREGREKKAARLKAKAEAEAEAKKKAKPKKPEDDKREAPK